MMVCQIVHLSGTMLNKENNKGGEHIMMARTSSAVTISQQVKQVYVYKLDHDTGMNPNPFGNFCTLAYCMHGMREKIVKHIAVQRSINPTLSITDMGIWIIGIAGKKT